MLAAQITTTSSPLPPPEQLAEYEKIVPGSAKTILDTFENQSKHRIRLERTVLGGNVRRSWTGLILGAIVCLAAFTVAGIAAANGEQAAAAFIGGVPVVSLAGIFVEGQRRQSRERVEKDALSHFFPFGGGMPGPNEPDKRQ